MSLAKARRLWFVALSLYLVLSACGEEAEPTPSVAGAPATIAAQTATVQPPLSTLPTATATPLIESPVPITRPLTQTDTITAVEAAGQAPLSCTEETDIALSSYPNLEQLMGCALGPASFDPVAINEFGDGPDFDRFMLWFSHELQIYVLRPDQSWQVYADTWTEDQPTFACNPLNGEATSPPLPRRGFGKLWCEVENLQAIMGTVTREERLCQHTVLQSFQDGQLLACYEDATIRYIRIMDDGTWAQVLVR